MGRMQVKVFEVLVFVTISWLGTESYFFLESVLFYLVTLMTCANTLLFLKGMFYVQRTKSSDVYF